MSVDSGGCCNCKRKLKRQEREILERELDGLMYTCGTSLQDLKLWPPLDEVYVQDVTCADHIEKLYFSAGYEPICIYCAGAVDKVNSDFSLTAVIVHNQKLPCDRITLKTYFYSSYIFPFCVV